MNSWNADAGSRTNSPRSSRARLDGGAQNGHFEHNVNFRLGLRKANRAQMMLTTEADLISVARALIDDRSALSLLEAKLLAHSRGKANPRAIAVVRGEILAGADPLGDAFCRMRSPAARRATGATYTPRAIVCAMVRWAAAEHVQPTRVVDPGAGSGRFLIASAEQFPLSQLVGVEVDPLACTTAACQCRCPGSVAPPGGPHRGFSQDDVTSNRGHDAFRRQPTLRPSPRDRRRVEGMVCPGGT
jgi:hypothetical protein